jgi:ribose 5-phosphate isomerase B
MKIAIASDHAGFELKTFIIDYLKQKNYEILDLGTNSETSVNYPDYGHKMAANILARRADLGILICGTGIGISIAANRHKGIRAAVLYSDEVAEMTKRHNNANVIVFGGRTMARSDVIKRIEIFLNTPFEGGRHQERIELLDK